MYVYDVIEGGGGLMNAEVFSESFGVGRLGGCCSSSFFFVLMVDQWRLIFHISLFYTIRD